MKCPLPAMNLKRKMKTMQPGTEITVLCNSKDSLRDIEGVAKVRGSEVLTVSQNILQKSGTFEWTLVIRA